MKSNRLLERVEMVSSDCFSLRDHKFLANQSPTNELPPNYSSPNLSATLSRHRNSLTIENRPPANFSATRRYRRSLGDAYLDIIPEHELRVTTPDPSNALRPSTSSAQNSRPSSSTDRPGTSSRTPSPQENITIQEPPRRVSIDIDGYEAPLPGAVTEENSDSPLLDVRRNSVRRPSCLTVSDLNVQTL